MVGVIGCLGEQVGIAIAALFVIVQENETADGLLHEASHLTTAGRVRKVLMCITVIPTLWIVKSRPIVATRANGYRGAMYSAGGELAYSGGMVTQAELHTDPLAQCVTCFCLWCDVGHGTHYTGLLKLGAELFDSEDLDCTLKT
jgi:hypothetical protein